MIHSLRAFRHRNFRLFFCGQSLGVIGYWVQQIAMSWLVYRLTGSAWLLGVTAFAGQIAVLVLAPFGGLWADRVERRKLLLATQSAAAVPAFTLAVLAYLDVIAVWHVIVMASALGVVMAVDAPIRQSFLPEMVPAREDLPSAIAFNSGMYNAARMIGPSIAGVLLTVSSEAFCFLVNGVTKVFALVPLFMMVIAARERPPAHASIWRGFRHGAAYAWGLVPVRLLLPVVALVSFMATPYQALMPIFAAEVFAGGADTLGFLIGAAGVGGICGILCLASRKEMRGLLRWIVAACGSAGAALVVFSYSTHFTLSLAVMVVAGAGIVITVNGISTITMTIVEDDMRGRVMGFYSMAFLGMYPVGSLAAGAAASWVGAAHTLAAGGIACMLGALWLARELPRLRRQIRPIYVRLGIINE
ncbi:MAG TPA: MFS transporter [Burkholderiales bacterium]|nr:MFS transporter [Burkholderiales bacterium]